MNRRVCVIGAGRWGSNHVSTLASMGALGGVVDKREAVRNALSEKHPGLRVHAEIEEALREGYDGYVVATPAETHFEIADALLRRGRHVLVEKPVALSSADARRLARTAEENRVALLVGHVMLFHPAIRRIKECIDSGKLGRLEYLYSNRLNLGTVRTEENILWSFAPHDISIFQMLIGQAPVEVVSRGGAFLQPAIHDTTLTVLKYPDNVIGHIFVSWLHPFKEHRLVVIGSKGMISYEDSSPEKQILFYEKGIDWVRGEPIKRDGPTEIIAYEAAAPLAEELAYFLARLDGSPGTVSDGRSAVEVMDILERASLSLVSGKETVATPAAGAPSAKPAFFVHPTAAVDDGVKIGEKTKIWHFSHVQGGSVIGSNCSIGQNVNIGNNVVIGNGVKIQNNVSVYEGVELEDYAFCGPSMVFTNIKQPRSEFPQRGAEFYLKTLVKKSASLGANCTVVCGTTIGRYAFVGAGSVVTKDVPDFALVVGNPARFLSWVCKCGAKLDFSKMKTTGCGKCKRKYRKTGAVIHCLEDGPNT
jgi:UDP-2-acetamido-3-amino-2,3-dideoxy-glucuronate N-acetyltransferase